MGVVIQGPWVKKPVERALPEFYPDSKSALSWQTFSGGVAVYHLPDRGHWVELGVAQGSPVGLTYAEAVAWIGKHYPKSKPLPGIRYGGG